MLLRIIQKLLLFVIFVIVLAIGLNFTLADVWRFGHNPVLRPLLPLMPWLDDPAFTADNRLFWFAVAMMPLVYWGAAYALWQRQPGAFRVQAAEGETLLLEPGALTKFARQQIEAHPAVVAQKVRVRQSGSRGLSITARVSVRPIQSLPSIRAGLEKAIRNGFSQVMGVEKIDEVSIIIGLDDRSMTQRPGVGGRPDPAPEAPVRSALPATAPAAIPAPRAADDDRREVRVAGIASDEREFAADGGGDDAERKTNL
jgi:hypothetical protein